MSALTAKSIAALVELLIVNVRVAAPRFTLPVRVAPSGLLVDV